MKNNKNKKGFTLAEILVTLTIIGVIAAILFPSILANYTEKTLKAKRQALFARMSQAMGEMADQFRNYVSVKNKGSFTDCLSNLSHCEDNGSALKFINEGFSNFYKISAVCDSDSLSACDIPDEITREDGSTFSLKDHSSSIMNYTTQVRLHTNYFPFDTQSAAFMTKNGESILLFYNPNCVGKSTYDNSQTSGDRMLCVNMIYDLNGGKNKPNKIGMDIGYISVLYNDSPFLAMPTPVKWDAYLDYEATKDSSNKVYPSKTIQPFDYNTAKANCSSLGDNIGLPSLEEAISMAFNRELWAPIEEQEGKAVSIWDHMYIWTSTMKDATHAWMIGMASKDRPENDRNIWTYLYPTSYKPNSITRCVYKD